MPFHDWSKHDEGIFHFFHRNSHRILLSMLNGRLLPADYYANTEKRADSLLPDVTTLNHGDGADRVDGVNRSDLPRLNGGSEPRCISFSANLAVRRKHGDQLVAIVDIIPPGDRSWVDERLRRAVAAGVHLLMVDVRKDRSLSDEVPLYIEPDAYVLLPLETTYHAMFHMMPARAKKEILSADFRVIRP